ncbi:Ig-like domain repeat protein [Acidicapsa dinghuensis]|uniref:Ig-like domain repeat protein n=1 Tax=Acidicapsa dinghuensis TaxID=2218256 RepID=A0ABW1EKU8_9BACT|nr:Ig-like domain repeat protein [Acidicapsa dinghuensis]
MSAHKAALRPAERWLRCLVKTILLSGGLISGLTLMAQSNRPALITRTVDDAQTVTLRGNVHPLATRAADRGEAPASLAEDRMVLVLKRSAQQELGLEAMLQSLQDKNSPNFHKWLTPAQYGAQWGASDADISAITAWLQSYGFSVAGPNAARDAIEFSGNVGQVEQAFHTQIHLYEVNGVMHHANATDPQIPAALAPAIAGIASMNDFVPKPQIRRANKASYNPRTHRAQPSLTGSWPNEIGANYQVLLVGPADAATIYNSPNPALNSGATGSAYTGTGSKIGVLGDSNIQGSGSSGYPQNLNYRQLFGLSAVGPTVVVDGTDPGETNSADTTEAYLDTEIAGGIAPGASVYLYIAKTTFSSSGVLLAAERALNDNIVDILSMSFSTCEAALGTGGNEFIQELWKQAAAQGISVVVATGDSGSAGCDDPTVDAPADYGLQVNGLASTPYNVAVGGTDFAVLAEPNGTGQDLLNYVSADSNPTTLLSALGYIPESPWNDSIQNSPPGAYSTNIPYLDGIGNPNIASGGGGKSNCAVGSWNGTFPACTSGYAKPSWQAGTGVPADQVRDVPDVSFFSGDGFNYAAWGICTDQDADVNGNALTDCTKDNNGNFNITIIGGTSTAAPTMAGVLAMLHQATGQRQGQVDYALYNLAKTTPSVFHDVTSGNNSVPCTSGTPDCSLNTQGNYFMAGYDAGVGYDLATGFGSLNISNLIKSWTVAGLSTTTTNLTVTPTTVQHGLPITASATVTSQNDYPTGNVMVLADMGSTSTTIGTYALNATGSTGTIDVPLLAGGIYNFIANYGGSAVNTMSSSSPVAVNITPEPSTTALTVSETDPANGSAYTQSSPVPYGYPISITAQPYGNHSTVVNGQIVPDGTATGTVRLTAGSLNLGTDTLGSDGKVTLSGEFLTPGSYTISAVYSGDASFEPSSATKSLVVAKNNTQLTLKANQTSYQNKPFDFTITLATTSAGAAPTGTVELMSGSTVLVSGTLTGKAGSGSVLASGSVTFNSVNIPDTQEAITARYSGDTNYAASTSNTVDVTGAPPFTISNLNVTLTSEHSTSGGTLTVTSTGAYAGTVDITCQLISAAAQTSSPPLCGMLPASVTVTAGGTATTTILFFGKGSKLPNGVTLGKMESAPGPGKWLAGGGAVLAFCVLFGIPARKRRWKAMIVSCLLLVAIGGFTACVSTPKFITAGTYTFRVTGVDSKNANLTTTATVNVKVL